MSIELTFEEIHAITGKVQAAAQLRELQRMGIRSYRKKIPGGPVCCLHVWLADRGAPGAQSKPLRKSEREKRGQAAQTR